MIVELIYFILVLTIKDTLGCHSTHVPPDGISAGGDGGEMKLRKKRQVATSYVAMEDFFVQCIEPFLWGSDIDVMTVVRFSVRETLWFQKTDESFCKSQDTTTCWSQTLYRYLNQNSRLLTIVVACIHRYGQQTGVSEGNITTSAVRPLQHSQQRRQATEGLTIDEAEIESQLRQILPPSIGDISTLITFAKEETICSVGICDCTGIQIPVGETCGQFWYTRIASLTRLDSATRSAITNVLNTAILRALPTSQPILHPTILPSRQPTFTPSRRLVQSQRVYSQRRHRLNLLLRYMLLWKLLNQATTTAAPETTTLV